MLKHFHLYYNVIWSRCDFTFLEKMLTVILPYNEKICINLCMLGNFSCLCCHLLTFSKFFRNTIRVSNSLNPDQAWSGSKPFAIVKVLATGKEIMAHSQIMNLLGTISFSHFVAHLLCAYHIQPKKAHCMHNIFSNFYIHFWKQCWSRSAGFWWSQLIRINTVFNSNDKFISIMKLRYSEVCIV